VLKVPRFLTRHLLFYRCCSRTPTLSTLYAAVFLITAYSALSLEFAAVAGAWETVMHLLELDDVSCLSR
jgi:hypothetical protein